MCDFVTRKVSAFKVCSEEFNPDEVIRILIRQMPNQIRNLLWNNMPETIDDLIERVSRFDQINDGNEQDGGEHRPQNQGASGYNKFPTKPKSENICAMGVRAGDKTVNVERPQGGQPQQQKPPQGNVQHSVTERPHQEAKISCSGGENGAFPRSHERRQEN